MAELRIHDQSSIYFKSIRTGTTTKDIDVKIPDKSGTLITDTTLQDILNRGGRFSASQILKPDITETPLEHPEAYNKLLPIASYRTSDTFVGEHTATEWVASEQPDFSIILDSTSDSLFRDGWYPAVNRPSVPVYVKYRFISEDVCSPYSDALEFTTPTGGVKIPTLSVLEDGVTPTVKGSPFALYGDATGINHVSSSWEVYRVRDNKLIKSITQDSSKLTEYKIEAGLLDSDTEYKFVLTYHTDHPVFSRTRKALGIYKTPESSIKTPTLSFNSDNNKYLIIGTPFVVNSGTDEHKFTAWEVKNATDAVVYTEPNSIDLTTLNLTGVLEPDSSYTVSAVYKGAKASSAKAVLTFRTPVETIDNLNKKITLTRLTNGGVELKMDKVQLATAEKLLYLTWTVQNYEKKVALEVRLDKDLDTKYGQDLIYTMTPQESWLKWFPNLDAVNPTLKLSAKGRVVGEKTILNYSTSAPFEYKPKIELGEMSVAGHTESLTPLVSITAHSGEDLSWITVSNATWELWKLQEGLNPVKVKSVDSNDLLKNRYNGLDYNTNYRATVVYNTNFGKYSKSIEFKSADIFLPRPNVIVESKGNTILIKVNNPDRNIPGKPEKSHGSTTWILYSNTGDTLWKSEKNTTNLTEITLPTGLLQGTTNYKVGVIFHSRDGLLSSNEGQASYYHRGIEIIEGRIVGNMGVGLNTYDPDYEPRLEGFEVYEGGVKSTTETIVSTEMKTTSELSKLGYYNTLAESKIPAGTNRSNVDNTAEMPFYNIKLRTTSGIEKVINNGMGIYPSEYKPQDINSVSIKEFTTGRYFISRIVRYPNDNGLSYSSLNKENFFVGKINIPNYTYDSNTYYQVPSDWEDNVVYYKADVKYRPMFLATNVYFHSYNNSDLYTIPDDILDPIYLSGSTDLRAVLRNIAIRTDNYTEPTTPNRSFNDTIKYVKRVTNGNGRSDIIPGLKRWREQNYGNSIMLTHQHLLHNTSMPVLQTRIFSPDTRFICNVEVETNKTALSTMDIQNLDKYFHYLNNFTGMLFTTDGQYTHVRFATKLEIKLMIDGAEHATNETRTIINGLKNTYLYFMQDNVDLTKNVKVLKIKDTNGSNVTYEEKEVPIAQCVICYTVTKLIDHTNNHYSTAHSRNHYWFNSELDVFKRRFKNAVFNINTIDSSERKYYPKVWMYAGGHNNDSYGQAIIDTIGHLEFGTLPYKLNTLNNEGYLTTVPADKFKSLFEIRTLLGLSPTNTRIIESELAEWYVFYWRDRIFFIPNIPIATVDEIDVNKWNCLYTINSTRTALPLVSIDKKAESNKYRLTMPTKTDLTEYLSLSIGKRCSSVEVNKYAKPGRLSMIGGELGDIINPDYFKLAHEETYNTELTNKLTTMYNKITSDKVLPFFELLPDNTGSVSNYITVGAKIIRGTDDSIIFKILFYLNDVYDNNTPLNTDTSMVKIDKIKVGFLGTKNIFKNTVDNRYRLESNKIEFRTNNTNNTELNFNVDYSSDKKLAIYTATIKKTNSLYPELEDGLKTNPDADIFDYIRNANFYIHFTVPNDYFLSISVYGDINLYTSYKLEQAGDKNQYVNITSFLSNSNNIEIQSPNLNALVLDDKEKTHYSIDQNTREYYSYRRSMLKALFPEIFYN